MTFASVTTEKRETNLVGTGLLHHVGPASSRGVLPVYGPHERPVVNDEDHGEVVIEHAAIGPGCLQGTALQRDVEYPEAGFLIARRFVERE